MKKIIKLSPLLSLFTLIGCNQSKQTISYVLVSPSGNDTAVVETPHDSVNARAVHDAISKIETTNEQTVFINKIGNKYAEIQMAGGEFCGNAARAVMHYLHDKYQWNSATLEYTGYFTMSGQLLDGNIAQVTSSTNNFIYSYSLDGRYANLVKVELSGITHYVVFNDCPLYQYRDDFDKTKDLIKNTFITPEEKSVGIMYWQPNSVLTPYVYVKDVDTMFRETACGSGTIATAYAAKKRWSTLEDEINIIQPSGKPLTVNFSQFDTMLSLRGVSTIVNKGFVQV